RELHTFPTRRSSDLEKDIKVITNFIDNKDFTECNDCQRSQFANDDEKILIHVSNLRPVKRVEEVLQIFKAVHKKVKSKLIIIGEDRKSTRLNSSHVK